VDVITRILMQTRTLHQPRGPATDELAAQQGARRLDGKREEAGSVPARRRGRGEEGRKESAETSPR